MSHLTESIFWLALSLIMAFCCIMNARERDLFAFVLCAIAFVLDISNAANEFSAWARELGRKDAQKKETEK